MTNQARFAPAIALAMALMFVVFASDLPHASATVAAQDVSPAALTELSIDNASSTSASLSCAFGLSDTSQTPRGHVQFSWANKLTPASYPATLRAVIIGLNHDRLTARAIFGGGDGISQAHASGTCRSAARNRLRMDDLAGSVDANSGHR